MCVCVCACCLWFACVCLIVLFLLYTCHFLAHFIFISLFLSDILASLEFRIISAISTHFYRNIRTHSCVCMCVCCRCVANKLLTIAKLAFCLLTFCYALLQLQRRELTNKRRRLPHTHTYKYTQRVRRMRECAGMWVAAWLNVCEWGTREQERDRQCVCVISRDVGCTQIRQQKQQQLQQPVIEV